MIRATVRRSLQVAHRLLDVSRKTQVNEIAKALRVLGNRVIIGVEKNP
ncbi:MAG: hypothetical protein ACHRXM_16075 [Isosphaerales bacterium]